MTKTQMYKPPQNLVLSQQSIDFHQCLDNYLFFLSLGSVGNVHVKYYWRVWSMHNDVADYLLLPSLSLQSADCNQFVQKQPHQSTMETLNNNEQMKCPKHRSTCLVLTMQEYRNEAYLEGKMEVYSNTEAARAEITSMIRILRKENGAKT